MAESPIGAPGGPSGGPHSATAATFQVNDSSLRAMRATWQGLTQDVKAFGVALEGLAKGSKTLDSVQAKLAALGVGGHSGGSGASGSLSAGHFTDTGTAPTVEAGTHTDTPSGSRRGSTTSESTFTDTSGGGGGGNDAGILGTRKRQLAAGAAGTLATLGGYYAARQDNITAGDSMYVEQAQAAGGGYRDTNRADAYHYMFGGAGQRGMQNYASTQDLLQGTQALLSSQGGAVEGAGAGRTRSLLDSAGRMAALNPTAAYSGSSAALNNLYNPGVNNRLRAYGYGGSLGAGGKRRSPEEIYRDVLRKSFRGRTPTAVEITEGMQEGSNFRSNLDALGLDQNSIDQVVRFGLAQANLGGSFDRTQKALADNYAGRSTADTKLLGLKATIQNSQNARGRAGARSEQSAGQGGREGLKAGFEDLAAATDTLTNAFKKMPGAMREGMGFLGAVGGPASNVLGKLGGPAGAFFTAQTARGLLGGSLSGGGIRGALKGGAGGALGASGLMGSPVYVTNWPAGGGFGGGGMGGNGLPLQDHASPIGPQQEGRLARLMRRIPGGSRLSATLRGTSMLRGGLAVGAGLAAFEGAGMGFNYLERHFGKRDYHGNKHVLDRLGTAAGTVGKYAAGGAAAGAVIGGPLGAAVGAVGGTAVGSIKSIFDWYGGSNKKHDDNADVSGNRAQADSPGAVSPPPVMSSPYAGQAQGDGIGHPPFGGSAAESTNRGPATVATIEAMAKGGPPSIVTSTFRPGSITATGGLSYHATHNAVDFAGPAGGVDTRELLAINKFFASKYGHGLKELIHAGPGGINLYNGAPHIFSKAVNDMHHNHVHVAATVDSLKSGGGVGSMAGAQIGAGAAADAAAGIGASGAGAGTPGAGDSGGGGSPGIDTTQAELLSQINTAYNAVGRGGGGAGAANAGAAAANGKGSPTAATAIGDTKTSSSVSANVATAQRMAAAMGWTGNEWLNLKALWQQESGFQSGSASANSIGSYGIPQAVPGSKLGEGPHGHPDWRTNAASQIDWGLYYIKDRYGSPSGAQAHKRQTDSTLGSRAQYAQPGGWYEKGAYDVAREHMAVIHPSEMVLDANTANKVRSSLRDRSSSEPSLAQSVMSALSSDNGRRGGNKITVHAPIQVVGTATEKNARDFLDTVKRLSDLDNSMDLIGGGH